MGKGGCREGIEREREGESEEEMDGGGRRDVRKQRVEGVFYGAIGKEQQKERDGGAEMRREVKQADAPAVRYGRREKRGCDDEEHERKEEDRHEIKITFRERERGGV